MNEIYGGLMQDNPVYSGAFIYGNHSFFDYNNDQYVDVLISREGSQVSILMVNNGAGLLEELTSPWDAIEVSSVEIFDIDTDSDDDLLVMTNANKSILDISQLPAGMYTINSGNIHQKFSKL